MSTEDGVNIINGTDMGLTQSRGSVSRSASPSSRKSVNGQEDDKPKKFQNGWSREQERLMAEWSDIATCYRWLHDKSEKYFHTKTLWINLPVIVLSTLGGTANFGIQSLFENDENAKKYASFAIGGISLFAGLLTTVGNYLRYAQLEESHRVAAIAWGKFQRLIAVELALKPDDRMDSLDFLKICRADLDRLIEQSPPIPKESIVLFEKKFGSIKDLKKPDICGALEHTHVFESSESRLKQAAVEAALLLRRKKQTLSELVTPDIEKRISTQIETRLNEAIESRKKSLEEEIEKKRKEAQKAADELEKAIEERKRRIQEEIDLEKRKLYQEPVYQAQVLAAAAAKVGGSQFESRLNYRRGSSPIIKAEIARKAIKSQQLPNPAIYSFEGGGNSIIIPSETQSIIGNNSLDDKIIVINRE
jgi:hypothetical protein